MPNNWPFQKITDHNDVALSRYTYQYTEAGTLQALTTLWSERMQALEDAAWSVLTDRWIAPAAGVQLDELGAIVGEPRLGRTDETYRDALEVRISINRSGGEPERIIEFLTRIANADQVIYKEIYPAKVEIFVGGGLSVSQALRVRDLVPAAVGTVYIAESDGETPFGTSGIGIETGLYEFDDGQLIELSDGVLLEYQTVEPAEFFDDVDGFGELGYYTLENESAEMIELSSGDLLGITDKEDPVPADEGGVIAELYEA